MLSKLSQCLFSELEVRVQTWPRVSVDFTNVSFSRTISKLTLGAPSSTQHLMPHVGSCDYLRFQTQVYMQPSTLSIGLGTAAVAFLSAVTQCTGAL
jgi:hypothetical protein